MKTGKKKKSDINERRVYFGKCVNGHGRFQSFKKSRIRVGLCSKCRKYGVSKDQIPMFEVKTDITGLVAPAQEWPEVPKSGTGGNGAT